MSHGAEERKLLLNYSDTLERATLLDPKTKDNSDDNDSMPARRRRRKGNKVQGGRGRRRGKGVRVNKGRLGLRVAGYQGVQHLTASELVRHIPLSKLKAAAKKVLKKSGSGRVGRRKGKKRGRKRKRKQ